VLSRILRGTERFNRWPDVRARRLQLEPRDAAIVGAKLMSQTPMAG
jgi:hypothetical protein